MIPAPAITVTEPMADAAGCRDVERRHPDRGDHCGDTHQPGRCGHLPGRRRRARRRRRGSDRQRDPRPAAGELAVQGARTSWADTGGELTVGGSRSATATCIYRRGPRRDRRRIAPQRGPPEGPTTTSTRDHVEDKTIKVNHGLFVDGTTNVAGDTTIAAKGERRIPTRASRARATSTSRVRTRSCSTTTSR